MSPLTRFYSWIRSWANRNSSREYLARLAQRVADSVPPRSLVVPTIPASESTRNTLLCLVLSEYFANCIAHLSQAAGCVHKQTVRGSRYLWRCDARWRRDSMRLTVMIDPERSY